MKQIDISKIFECEINMLSLNFEEIFPNSPINEVAFEIRFPANLSIEGEIYKFHEKIKTEFPIFKEG